VIEAGNNKLILDQSVIKEYFDLLYCDLDHRKIRAMQFFLILFLAREF
jgi:chorismate dehydratase